MQKNSNRFVKSLGALWLTASLLLPCALAAQTRFSSPEMAVDALVESLAINDETQMRAILGKDYRSLLPLDAVSQEDLSAFLEAWAKGHRLVMQGDAEARLELSSGWVMPIPLVKEASGWRFDVQEAQNEIRQQRIGRNELAVIGAMHAYVEAQKKYAEQDYDGDGIFEYSQKIMSTPGTQDGLLWVLEDDVIDGLVDPLVSVQDLKDGYHGYRFKILKAQGEAAAGGRLSYLEEGQMTRGFAMVAWPLRYGDTGVMSFIVNQDGQVYEKSLGRDSAAIAKAMTRFNPDASWKPVSSVP